MYRPAKLSPQHYAAKWKVATTETLNKRDYVNQLGIRYANLPVGPEREEVLWEIVGCFHGLVTKYSNMIILGHMPALKTRAGKDSAAFLRMLVPQKHKHAHNRNKIGRLTLLATCRTLHLAFKQMTADDIYDALVLCLMRAVDKYNPNYTERVKQVCGAIDGKAIKRRQSTQPEFTTADITGLVGFDSLSCLRMLVRKGFLASVSGPKKKVLGYRRAKSWPPPSIFFKSGPVGFVYFVSLYFRYYLHEHISRQMDALESQDGVVQLDHRLSDRSGNGLSSTKDIGTPHAEGVYVDRDGNSWAADTELMRLPLDVSTMTLEWVKHTDDKLFRKLTTQERHLLYMVFVQEYKWIEIAATLNSDTQTVRKHFDQVIKYLRGRAEAKRHVEPEGSFIRA